MEAISKIKLDELAPQQSERLTLTRRLRTSLPDATVLTLMALMRQVEARYPGQVIEEVTKEMYLAEWEEMAVKYDLLILLDALLKVIGVSKFFPAPDEIREWCASISQAQKSRLDALEHIRKHDAAKAQWEREREQRTRKERRAHEP